MSNLRDTIALLLARAVYDIFDAIDDVFDEPIGSADYDDEFDDEEDCDDLATLLGELMTPEVEPTPVAKDLWDHPPAPADSWPKVEAQPATKGWPHTAVIYKQAAPAPWPRVAVPSPVAYGATAAVAAPVAPPLAPVVAAPSRTNVLRETVSRDGRSRACVPNNMTKSLGIKPLNFVYVAKRAHGAKGLVILKKVAKTGHVATYRVDKDGNIRLSEHLLSKGGLGRSTSIRFRTSNSGDSIIVLAG